MNSEIYFKGDILINKPTQTMDILKLPLDNENIIHIGAGQIIWNHQLFISGPLGTCGHLLQNFLIISPPPIGVDLYPSPISNDCSWPPRRWHNLYRKKTKWADDISFRQINQSIATSYALFHCRRPSIGYPGLLMFSALLWPAHLYCPMICHSYKPIGRFWARWYDLHGDSCLVPSTLIPMWK